MGATVLRNFGNTESQDYYDVLSLFHEKAGDNNV